MGYRTNNVHLFELGNDNINDYIDMWTLLDSDYSEDYGDNYGDADLSAKDIVTKVFNEWDDCDLSRLTCILEKIRVGHGSYSDDFQWDIIETDDHIMFVAISYLT